MKNDKKEQIFDAMEQLLLTVPSGEISVDAIAKQAGIGKGSIYYYFKSKDEILSAVIERSYRRAIREYFNSISAEKNALKNMPALEKIKRLFQNLIKEDFQNNEQNLIVTLHLADDLALHKKMKYIAVQEIAPILTDLLKQGIAEGSIETDTPKESAEMIVAVLTFFLDDTIFPETPTSMKNKLKIFARVLETSLKTEEGSFDFLYRPISK
ncbi:MAG: TetR/AcrR family transcriptional regulator [Oscillospiraceae bacterium]|nr:TetR/AcrR family transcriptional regulator [Oscillospiraceae bacterium]MDY2510597.1 TetR/AcrR family transcriptional regulator [Ruminococcus callidus]